jgi:hypothetical protein
VSLVGVGSESEPLVEERRERAVGALDVIEQPDLHVLRPRT